MMLASFLARWLGQKVDFDGVYGAQCMDLAEQYNQDVVGAPRLGGNAIDVWTHRGAHTVYRAEANGPVNYPPPGALVVWGPSAAVDTGEYGHIAICLAADPLHLISLDQNWPDGAPISVISHSYSGVLGWLTPLVKVS